MTELTWTAPAAATLAKISPSALNTYDACPRKLAFQRDGATRALDRPAPRTSLGVVAHGLSEFAAKSSPPAGTDVKVWLTAEWDRLLEIQAAAIASAWPGRTVPPIAQWNGLVATRVKTLRRLVTKLASEPTVRASGRGPSFPWIERRLEDPITGVSGTPDRVDVRDGKLRVVDLKSGVHQAGIQEHQRRQLLLYAHLVDVVCGQLPAIGVIEDVGGVESSFSIESVAVTGAVQEAQKAIAEFNSAASSGDIEARPDKTSCRFCPFRSVCWPYWGSPARSDRDVRGMVVDSPGVNSFNVDVGAAELLRVVLTPGVEVPNPGNEIVVLDVDPAGPSTVRMRWNSAIREAAER